MGRLLPPRRRYIDLGAGVLILGFGGAIVTSRDRTPLRRPPKQAAAWAAWARGAAPVHPGQRRTLLPCCLSAKLARAPEVLKP